MKEITTLDLDLYKTGYQVCYLCFEKKRIFLFSKNKKHVSGYSGICLVCFRASQKDSRDKNIEKYNATQRKYYKNLSKEEKERRRENNKKYVKEHKEELYKNNKKYREENREVLNANRNKYFLKRKAEDENYKLSYLLRDRFRKALKGEYKTGSAVRDLGCSIPFLKFYLEEMFYDSSSGEKMMWENHGCGNSKWHLDHIVPLSLFDLTDRDQFLAAFNFRNLRPLWGYDNNKKKASLHVKELTKKQLNSLYELGILP